MGSLCRLALLLPVAALGAVPAAADVQTWPEAQRAFLEDGPGLLLGPEERREVAGLDEEDRQSWIDAFLAAAAPGQGEEAFRDALERRQELMFSQVDTPLDARGRLLFLHGEPAERQVVECAEAFKPLELWRYGDGPTLVLYQPQPGAAFQLWEPFVHKQDLYIPEVAYWLEQIESMVRQGTLRVTVRGGRFDRYLCEESREVDRATGISGLTGYERDRPSTRELEAFLAPPADLDEWTRAVLAAPASDQPEKVDLPPAVVYFPDQRGQRMFARLVVTLPADLTLEIYEDEEEGKREHRIRVDGLVEHEGEVFDRFQVRFQFPPPGEGRPAAVAVDRLLRPERSFVVRLQVTDELGDVQARLALGFRVPTEPEAMPLPPVPEEAILALGEELGQQRLAGADGLVLVPPVGEVVTGLWRAEAIVTGERIGRVVFLVDGAQQLARNSPPFHASIRLPALPTTTIVRAEGYDGAGALVAADEIVLNQPRGRLQVRIVEPARGAPPVTPMAVRAEVVVPDGRRIESVQFHANDRLQATRTRPPWEARMELPLDEELVFVTVVAELDNGLRAEDMRFVKAPALFEQVDVNLVELYTTVVDRSGRPLQGLGQEEFRILEDGRPQRISRFEEVRDLPLHLGLVIDTSGSMLGSLPEVHRAGTRFLEEIMTPRDRAFLVEFSSQAVMRMPMTDDIHALSAALGELRAEGWTALYDALAMSLHYFRGTTGRRALVLLSDGEDNSSKIGYRELAEFARRSGVAIYVIGLQLPAHHFDIRRKLRALADETGGRALFVSDAQELEPAYREIEEELRSQYLLAFVSDREVKDGEFREVEVEVKTRGLRARTIRGYYP